jgi:hypothetical protein
MVDFSMVTFKPEKAEVQQLSSLAGTCWPSPQVRGGGVVENTRSAAVVIGAGVVAQFVVGAGVVVAAGVVVRWAVIVSCTFCSHWGSFRVSDAQEMQHFSPLQKVPFSMATKPVLQFLQLPSPTSSA